jgi:predicted permease
MLLRRLRSLMRRRQKAADLNDEIRFHLETEAEERRERGSTPADAERAARIDFGNVAVIAEDTRATWGWTTWEQLAQDVRYAIRTLSKSRAFTATAVVSLALGIGANTLLYSLTDAILLRALPVSDPQALVRMTWRTPQPENHGMSRHDTSIRSQTAGYTNGVFAYAAFELFERHEDIFASVFAYQNTGPISLTIHDQTAPAIGEYVSGNYFRGLGVVPAAGRWLFADDDRSGAPPAVVISAALADGRFGGSDAAVGQTLLINTAPFTIVGVTGRSFFGTDPGVTPDFYVPLHSIAIVDTRRASDPLQRFNDPAEGWLEIMGRLKPEVSLELAQATLAPPFQQFTERVKASGSRWTQAPTLALVAGGQGIDGLRRGYSTPLLLLMGLAGLILLLACSNIANLLLARSAAREQEIALRMSLGAARVRVIRQLLTESAVLSVAGGMLGVAVVLLGEPLVMSMLANGRSNFTLHAGLNWRVMLFTSGLSLLTGLLFGVVPAMRSTRTVRLSAIKDARSTAASVSGRRRGPTRAMVVLQMGATLVLLITAGLFARTLANFAGLDLGFNPDRVLTVTLNAKQVGFDDAGAAEIYRDLRSRFAAIPGVVAVSMSDSALMGDGRSGTTVVPVGIAPKDCCYTVSIGAGFFRTMEVPLARGRDLDETDERTGAKPVVVINESYAREYFGNANPLGQRLEIPSGPPKVAGLAFEIVGVARDVNYGRLVGERPAIVFVPFQHAVFGSLQAMVYEIRTSLAPADQEKAIRQIVHDVNARIPITRVAMQTGLIDRLIATPILLTRLCVTFAILALTMAVVGLYGSISYDVSRRTREIGVRMALGARRGQVVRLILGNVVVLAAIGIALGVIGALYASKVAQAYLYGVTPRDPMTVTGAILVLLTATCLASYAPARAAARLDPTQALRNE